MTKNRIWQNKSKLLKVMYENKALSLYIPNGAALVA